MKKIVSLLVALVLLISLSYAQQLRVFTIGGSTVQDYNDGYAPRKGWGQMLSFFFDKSKAVVYNKVLEEQVPRVFTRNIGLTFVEKNNIIFKRITIFK